ncbi:sensor histidine kinase [Alicyclobacillus macrosporangiidus]|uniref:histidine kinase n=1 Tax=Alicyclobacillus macrosporangiidus TaxID=392015 RepID=A0A1I7KLV0_9BACL|nr:ATP-binding protein [Alicyclobacillus macrosporangiidus]SFU98437.1 two-component system, OmpR family, sensor histidine kinase ResE [Alicyclobacillus macrosporangiidus]
MIRNSIVAKLWLTIVAMVVLVLVLLSILLQQVFDNYVYEQQVSELTRLASTVKTLVLENDESLATHIASELADVQQAHIAIYGSISESGDGRAMYQRLSADQQEALSAGQTVTVRGVYNGADTVAVYALIPGASPGLLEVRQRMSVLHDPLARMRNLILFAMALGVILTTGLAFVISKNLSRPLVQMNRAAELMARGNFSGEIEVVTRDEVGRLGRTFNALASELERTIAALTQEKYQLSSILSSLRDGVVAADLDGYVTLMNPPAQRTLSQWALADRGVPEVTRLPGLLLRVTEHVLERKETRSEELMVLGRQMVVTTTPLYTSDGRTVRGTVSVLRDVTEERRLDRLRKDFIANVSHELRTPLSMMQGYAEALLDEFGDDPEQRRELAWIIHDETLRMKRLVNDLLNLAQLESGQFHMNFEQVDLVSVVRRVARKFQTLAADRGLDLQASVPGSPVWVWGDPDRLEQVFTNLVDNAIRHTQPGGRVRMEVAASPHHARVRVSDTGSGIPPEDIPYIWERFYKADKARTRGTSGTGLGLAITRHIVLEHKGDVVVESRLGSGTTFTVSLPLYTGDSRM